MLFWFLFFVALAAGCLMALCYHLQKDHPRWRIELRTGLFWSAVIFAGAMLWLTVDVVRDWL